MKSKILFSGMMLALTLGSASTFARDDYLIDGSSPRDVLEVARGFGSASLESDAIGEPMIQGRMSGIPYQVYFHRCDDAGENCSVIRFYNYWTEFVSMESINEWNAEKLFSKAYIDEDGDAVLEMTANLYGGVTQINLDDSFDWWKIIIEEFEAEVVEGQRPRKSIR